MILSIVKENGYSRLLSRMVYMNPRLRDKYVMTRNPMNFRIRFSFQINLSLDFMWSVLSFWTKNADFTIYGLFNEELNHYGIYVYVPVYTITHTIILLERNISDKSDIIKMYWEIIEKSKKNESYGRDMILFYLNDTYTVNQHIETI